MNRKSRRWIQYLARVPIMYQLAAFVSARRVNVRGTSMSPTLEPGERVLFNRLAYVVGEPQVGDIVLARHDARSGMRMIKRVVAHDGLAEEELWLVGDNEAESTDSRTLGPFQQADIAGRAWVVYWPPGRFRVIGRRSVEARP
jgi:signal peptidase I